MKLLIISDTHNNISTAQYVIGRLSDRIEAVLHLGDMTSDAQMLEEQFEGLTFHYVAGNGDFYYSAEPFLIEEKVVEYSGVKIFMTHGHKYKIKYNYLLLAAAAKEKGAQAVLCGHTHVPFSKLVDDILVINPGSLTYPRGEPRLPSYAVLDISPEGKLEAGIVLVKPGLKY